MVRIDIEGANCPEIAEALHGFEKLNTTVDNMFSDLARRVFPTEGEAVVPPRHEKKTGR
jgi:hypothetical protein